MTKSSTKKNAPFQWLHCPVCDKESNIKIYKNTTLLNFPLICPECMSESLVNVFDFKIKTDEEMKQLTELQK